MNTRIPDLKIKSFVYKYKSGDTSCYSLIVELLSPYIYNYPRIVFSSDPDRCSDFYEYILARLEKILAVYKESEAKFITWFTVVLRNRYRNFIRERSSKSSLNPVSLDYSSENSRSLYNLISENRNYFYSTGERYDSLIDTIVRYLNERQRIFFHLYFIETLRPEDIGFISIALNKAVREVLLDVDGIRNSMVRKYRIKNEVLEKLSVLHQEILKRQSEDNEDGVEKLKEKRKKVLEAYRRIKLNPSYESLSRFLNLPLGTVSTGISRMKRAVRSIIEEIYHEELPVS